MNIKKHIPNLITLLNLLCGCIATFIAVWGDLRLAGFFVFAGIFFDFFDGLAARVLNVKSELGLQLDSLADVVTSGVVPGIFMVKILGDTMHWEIGTHETIGNQPHFFSSEYFPAFGFLITLGAAYRLAKFNIDESQTTSFIGLPTPANAILIISTVILIKEGVLGWIDNTNGLFWFLIALTVFSTIIMNVRIPLFGLKFKTLAIKDNENKLRYFFLGSSIILLISLKFIAVPLIIIWYITLSIIQNMTSKKT